MTTTDANSKGEKERGPDSIFIWTQRHIDDLNKWFKDTADTLNLMRAQFEILHDQLFPGNSGWHDTSADCPICRSKGFSKLKLKAQDANRSRASTGGGSDIKEPV